MAQRRHPLWQNDARDIMRLLKRLRVEAKVGQEEMAKHVGLSNGASVSKRENLHTEPSLSFIRRFAGRLGYHVQMRLIPAKGSIASPDVDLEYIKNLLDIHGLRLVIQTVPIQDHPDIYKEEKAGEEDLGTAKDLDP